MYTEDQLMARLRFFIGVCLALTLTGIVFVVLYSLIFVTQPLNAISPIDQKFFELIVPIATFLTGTLSGIMLAGGDKDASAKAMEAANRGWEKPPTPPAPAPSAPMGSIQPFSMNTPAPTNNFGPSPSFNSFVGRQEPVLGFPESTPQPGFAPQVVTGFGGKPGPAQPPQPEI
jgi:hypothetical protein